MNKDNFDEILVLVQGKLDNCLTHSRPISPVERLALTLRYLASENSMTSIGMSYRISPSSVSKILRQVIPAISKILGPLYLPKPNEQLWKQNEEGFRNKWNFPNACGALDGKHIKIQAPRLSGSTHYNYKNFFSVVLMAVASHDKFLYVDIGSAGSQSDGVVFSRSSLLLGLENENVQLPQQKSVRNTILPYVLLGDDAFPLREYLMKPYLGKFLPQERRIFNYRQSKGRMVVKNAFGIISARWRIFHSIIIADVKLIKQMVESCVILHNYLIQKKDMNTITVDHVIDNGEAVFENWRDDQPLQSIRRQESNNHGYTAAAIRDSFKDYFRGEGCVPWQYSRI